MKYTLTIEADSVTELFDALAGAASHDMYQPTTDAIAPVEKYEQPAMINDPPTERGHHTNTYGPGNGPTPVTIKRVTLPTGEDPADVYGPGNGPVETMYRAVADAPAPAPAAPTVDANNMPHDERIHAGSKALNADGTWRKKRGVSYDLVRRVEAECVTSTVYADNVSGSSPVLPQEDVTTITGTYTGAYTTSAPTPASIMSRIAALVTSGDKTPAYVQEIVKSCDLTDGIAQIASDSDALERVVAALQADGVL